MVGGQVAGRQTNLAHFPHGLARLSEETGANVRPGSRAFAQIHVLSYRRRAIARPLSGEPDSFARPIRGWLSGMVGLPLEDMGSGV